MDLDKIKQFAGNKKRLIIICVIVIFVVLTVVLLSSPSAPAEKVETSPESQILTSPLPTKSAREIQAISDQVKEDEKFAEWERGRNAQFPWINRIPLRTDRYFVYFDLQQGVFIGLLYPKAGEDVERMKSEIITVLKDVKEIPADKFEFKWTVFPE